MFMKKASRATALKQSRDFLEKEENKRGVRILVWMLAGAAVGFQAGSYVNNSFAGVGIGALVGIALSLMFDEKWMKK